jgi:hypothetical protein
MSTLIRTRSSNANVHIYGAQIKAPSSLHLSTAVSLKLLSAQHPGQSRGLATQAHTRFVGSSGNASAKRPKQCRSTRPFQSSNACGSVSSNSSARQHRTHHHPCPSKTKPHGMPISLRHLMSLEQYSLSRVQIPKPPRKMLSPHPIIHHMTRSVSRSS